MILVLCANAGVDRTYEVDNFAVGQYHHPHRQHVTAGGKGINVARTIRALGLKVTVTGFVGGVAARFIEHEIARIGARPAFVRIGEESRVCINIIDRHSRSQTRLDELGPLVTPSEVDRLRERWRVMLQEAKLAVISGSAPRGAPKDLYAELVDVCRGAGVPVILDARDELLAHALAAKPTVVRVNVSEAEGVVGRTLALPGGVYEVARQWVDWGVEEAIISFGAQGAIGVGRDGQAFWARPPEVEYVSGVGSGDAMVGGIAAAMYSGLSLLEQLRWGTACGAANAASFGACLFDRRAVHSYVSGVEVILLEPGGRPIAERPDSAGQPATKEE
ncbi:MAG: 1-phosphofructokinase family hexose kinase [Armatimonadetes bacterium]|nr:1-phosphofructokinase family hexose kinase [Armatimonadota bacterium]